MKKLTFTLLATLAPLASSLAGQQYAAPGKESKPVVEPMTCFNDREFQLDLFGAYTDGNAQEHAGPIRDHGWGGGIGLNYFFTRMVGVGVDATVLYARENAGANRDRDGGRDRDDSNDRYFQSYTGSLILRFPSDETCLAPYIFAGGGFHTDGDNWASAHGGLGIEYRVTPHRIGLFTDARWTYFGDRYGHGDQNNFTARAGVRFVF